MPLLFLLKLENDRHDSVGRGFPCCIIFLRGFPLAVFFLTGVETIGSIIRDVKSISDFTWASLRFSSTMAMNWTVNFCQSGGFREAKFRHSLRVNINDKLLLISGVVSTGQISKCSSIRANSKSGWTVNFCQSRQLQRCCIWIFFQTQWRSEKRIRYRNPSQMTRLTLKI